MSSSQHPVALTVERRVGGATKLLATIMCLPLVDGIFPALVLAGALDDPIGILEVGLLIFGGSATVAVVLAEMDGSRREVATAILAVGAVLLPIAAVEAALAPTIRDMLNMPVFSRFAGLVILTVAAKTASARIGEYLPRPAIVIALGLVASFDPSGVSLSVTTNPELIARAVAAAGVGVGFALLVALLGPWLRAVVDIDRFRFGSAVALGVLPLSIFGLVPGDAPIALAVLGVTALFAFDPDGDREYEGVPGDTSDDAPVADGGEPDDSEGEGDGTGEDESVPGRVSDYVTTDDERAPWL
ncbi:hypothetical protein C475_15193 [Halosimplex carlsbadense 2-9-1]|uniref:Uncharacterized protein n=1 Tax=Halosimplex carlsbadense 2-9-1 TaxID=797114 RepID=M0CLY1_9EURY|nr:DUF5794 domain-containing protein [Halosimplex carlsbadense]ELZ23628.1 hypothetical protein C475_15193 [Halosimplex carlsbadense 2-9-1]